MRLLCSLAHRMVYGYRSKSLVCKDSIRDGDVDIHASYFELEALQRLTNDRQMAQSQHQVVPYIDDTLRSESKTMSRKKPYKYPGHLAMKAELSTNWTYLLSEYQQAPNACVPDQVQSLQSTRRHVHQTNCQRGRSAVYPCSDKSYQTLLWTSDCHLRPGHRSQHGDGYAERSEPDRCAYP